MPHVVVYSAMTPCSSWAHDINTIKMADGFAKRGCEVTLVTRRGEGQCADWQGVQQTYGLEESMRWVTVPFFTWGLDFDRYWHPRYSRHASKTIIKLKPDLLYARDNFAPVYCSRAGVASAVESHASVGTTHKYFRFVVGGSTLPSFKAWVTISDHLADYYNQEGVPREKLLVLPDAVDTELFGLDHKPEQADPFADNGRKRVLYAGHLYDYKGIPTLLEAAAAMPELDFHFVGGWPEDIERHRTIAKDAAIENVVFHGLKPFAEVPRYLWYADALLLPPSANHPSAKWTSPVKLGEYMASGTPVIASDIPALRHWVSDDQVWFFRADDAGSLVNVIRQALSDREAARDKVDRSLAFASKLTYKNRAGRVLDFVLPSS